MNECPYQVEFIFYNEYGDARTKQLFAGSQMQCRNWVAKNKHKHTGGTCQVTENDAFVGGNGQYMSYFCE